MTNQDKIVWLRQYRELDSEINHQLEELSRLRAMATSMSVQCSDMPRGGAGEDRLQAAVARIVDLDAKIAQDIDRLADLRSEIGTAINGIQEPRLRELLRRRYIDGETFEAISVHMHYSYMHICRLHGQALDRLVM